MSKKSLISLSNTESKHLIVTVLVLTLVFGFNDKRATFEYLPWFSNFIQIFVLATITILTHELAHKLAARYFNVECEHRVWSIHKYWFSKATSIERIKFFGKHIKSFPLGIFIAIFLMLISYGKLFFSAVSTFVINETTERRAGRWRQSVTEYQVAIIAIAGIFANLILLFIFNILGIQEGVLINSWFILFNLLPISTLTGAKIFYNSIPIYIFIVLFSILCILLVPFLSMFLTIILATITAVFFSILYLRKYSGYGP